MRFIPVNLNAGQIKDPNVIEEVHFTPQELHIINLLEKINNRSEHTEKVLADVAERMSLLAPVRHGSNRPSNRQSIEGNLR